MRVAMLAAAFLSTGAVAQQTSSPQDKSPPPDVVVEAERGLTRDEQRAGPRGFTVPGYDPDDTIAFYDGALGASRCATSGRLRDLTALHAVVDGVFNSSAHDRAMNRLMQTTATCGMGSQVGFYVTEPFPASEREVGVIHRGAFMLRALEAFAPDLVLTRAQLADASVQQRFRDREGPRNRFRVPRDMAYLKVATCLVQRDPEAALRIVRTHGRADLNRIGARMIDRHRDCVGGARRVLIDWLQFRLAIADATYRWAVAAKGVASLIPAVETATLADQPIR